MKGVIVDSHRLVIIRRVVDNDGNIDRKKKEDERWLVLTDGLSYCK